MTERQEEVLRNLLHGRQQVFPVMVYGLLGGDPNDITVEEYATIADWLHRLGYERRVRPRFSHATMMAVWVRDDDWPGEELGAPPPYDGIPLRQDPDLAEPRSAKVARQRAFYRALNDL